MNIFLPLSWTAILLFLLLLPGSRFPQTSSYEIPNIDKLAHFILFAGLAFWWAKYFKLRLTPIRWKSSVWLIVLLATILGIMLEFVQHSLIPNRSFEVVDILANSLGALSAGIFLTRAYKNS